jgi:cellulose synthase/poly-beta-1,6-N-acetylglucosamine synthase-like glycosyltransferase
MTQYYIFLVVCAVIVYVFAVDPNVAIWVELQIKNLWVQIKRRWYLTTWYPQMKYNNWVMLRRLKKMRKEMGLPNE